MHKDSFLLQLCHVIESIAIIKSKLGADKKRVSDLKLEKAKEVWKVLCKVDEGYQVDSFQDLLSQWQNWKINCEFTRKE